MRALLLAAGLGTRLRPITDTIPKCLVEINGRPLLQYWLDLFSNSEINEVLINTHYLPEKVMQFIEGQKQKFSIRTVYEERLLGTGGTILRNRDFFSQSPFLVAHADNLTLFNVDDFVQSHRRRLAGVEITMMTFDTDAPQTCGIVETDDIGKVIAFHEKVSNPPGSRANAAVYIFEPSVIDYLETKNSETIDLSTEVIPEFLGRIQVFHNAQYHRDIGNPESLMLANEYFSQQSMIIS